MKRIIYLLSFSALGFLLQLLLHAIIEQWYISLLLSDFDFYGFGLSWSSWFMIHSVLTVVLTILGALLGLKFGLYWWGRLYDEKGKLRSNIKWLFRKRRFV